MSIQNVIIFGNGVFAIEAYHLLSDTPERVVVAFAVNSAYMRESEIFGIPVVPFEDIETRYAPAEHSVFVAVGYQRNNRLRAERLDTAKQLGYGTLSIVAPTAVLTRGTTIGENCMIGHYTTVSPHVAVGNSVFIGNHCSIAHDVTISDHCFFSNHVAVSGRVSIGSHCYFGTSSTIRNSVAIASGCIIGAGALILENTEESGVYLGAAATILPIRSHDLTLG